MSERLLAFDCFSGIAGDMTLAALVDAGANLDAVIAGLRKLGLPSFELRTEKVMRSGLPARYLHVSISEERTYQPPEMRQMITAAGLPPRVTARALAAVAALERGEALAHETDTPHLHEAGGVDAMIDLTGAMLALEDLGIDQCYCPVVTVGAGTIARGSHGAIPAAPGPATAHILREAGFPMRFVEAGHELVTPTGAAILAAVAKPRPVTLVTQMQGAGAGTFDPPTRPNAVRVFIGSAASELGQRTVMLLEANVDDMPATLLAHARDRLMDEGALDAWTEAIGMKKGRAASKLCALVPEGEEARFAALFLRETTTLGVRTAPYRRFEATRRIETFASTLGDLRVKVSEFEGRSHRTPEFEDVKALAAKHGLPAIEVQRRVERELESGEGR